MKLLDDGGTDNNGSDTFKFPQKLTIKVTPVPDPPVIALSTQSVVVNVDSSCVTAVGHVNISTTKCLASPPAYQRSSMSSCVASASPPPYVNIFAAFVNVESIESPTNAVFTLTPYNASVASRIFATQPTVLFPCGALYFKLKVAQSGIVRFSVTLTRRSQRWRGP